MKGIEQAQILDSRRFSCNLIPAAHLVPLLDGFFDDVEDIFHVVVPKAPNDFSRS